MNIDGISSVTVPLSENIALSLIRNLEMESANDNTTTETNFNYFKKLKSLLIKIKYKQPEKFSLIVTGSLHKYFHGRNNNDFFEYQLELVKKEIFQYLEMDIAEIANCIIKPIPSLVLPLRKVEVGINIEIVIDDISAFLKNNLQLHKKEPFITDDNYIFTCRHEHYYLKIYNKGNNLLRFEMVFLTRELKKYNILCLSDLTKDKIVPMLERLKTEAAEILFSDGVNLHTQEGITKSENLKLLQVSSAWRNNDFKNDKKNAEPRQRKNMNQRMWRLGVLTKRILTEKGAGYKKIFVDAVNDKVDSFLTQNELENVYRL